MQNGCKTGEMQSETLGNSQNVPIAKSNLSNIENWFFIRLGVFLKNCCIGLVTAFLRGCCIFYVGV